MNELDLLRRAALAAGLNFVLGWGRERRGSPAVDRTYALVGLRATTLAGLVLLNIAWEEVPGLRRIGHRKSSGGRTGSAS